MAESLRLAAVDLGAESGRVVLGRFDGEAVSLEVAHRFANRPVWLPDGLHWNVPALFADALQGLAAAADGRALDGVGIDGWGVTTRSWTVDAGCSGSHSTTATTGPPPR